jgi:hypothetical protein
MECWLSTGQGLAPRVLRGSSSAWGAHRLSSTFVSRLICAGWCRMTGVCEMRSGAVCLASSVALLGLLSVFSRVAPRVVAPVRSPRRAVSGRGYSIVASAQQ